MMNKQQQIKKQIKQIELQLQRLAMQSSKNEICEDLQNSLILKKAILKKELENSNKNKFIEKIKQIIPRKKKLICDYFN